MLKITQETKERIIKAIVKGEYDLDFKINSYVGGIKNPVTTYHWIVTCEDETGREVHFRFRTIEPLTLVDGESKVKVNE